MGVRSVTRQYARACSRVNRYTRGESNDFAEERAEIIAGGTSSHNIEDRHVIPSRRWAETATLCLLARRLVDDRRRHAGPGQRTAPGQVYRCPGSGTGRCGNADDGRGLAQAPEPVRFGPGRRPALRQNFTHLSPMADARRGGELRPEATGRRDGASLASCARTEGR